MKKSKTKIFNIRMPLELLRYIKDMSAKNYTSMSNYIIQLIVKDMEINIENTINKMEKKLPKL